jgi:hypothetical protein
LDEKLTRKTLEEEFESCEKTTIDWKRKEHECK